MQKHRQYKWHLVLLQINLSAPLGNPKQRWNAPANKGFIYQESEISKYNTQAAWESNEKFAEIQVSTQALHSPACTIPVFCFEINFRSNCNNVESLTIRHVTKKSSIFTHRQLLIPFSLSRCQLSFSHYSFHFACTFDIIRINVILIKL